MATFVIKCLHRIVYAHAHNLHFEFRAPYAFSTYCCIPFSNVECTLTFSLFKYKVHKKCTEGEKNRLVRGKKLHQRFNRLHQNCSVVIVNDYWLFTYVKQGFSYRCWFIAFKDVEWQQHEKKSHRCLYNLGIICSVTLAGIIEVRS